MKLALLVLVAACHASADDYPIGPGGPPGGSARGPDAGTGPSDGGDAGDGDAGVLITGKVCVVTDLRKPTACPNTAVVRNVTVSISATRTATPDERGEFSIFAPPGAFTWHVTGRDIVPSIVPFGPDARLPVIDQELYLSLENNNSVTPSDAQGAVVMRVVKANVPVTSVTAVSNPATPDLARYDQANSAIDWRSDNLGTGPAGAVWLPDVPAENPITGAVRLTPPVGTPQDVLVPVEPQSITFVTVELP